MDFIMTDKTSSLLASLASDKGPWYEGIAGERVAVRLSSADTNGAFAIIESVSAPGCSPPMHLHRNEEEHFVVLAGTYRILIEDKVFDAPAGTSVTAPKGARHSWRNMSDETGRLLIILTPGGFEKCIQTVHGSASDKGLEIAAEYGCLVVGPPISVKSSRPRKNRGGKSIRQQEAGKEVTPCVGSKSTASAA